MKEREQIIEILNKYCTTEVSWLKEFYGNHAKFIDPMDYHKIENEILALPLYPKSFVEWLQDDCPFWYEMINKYWEEPDSDKKYTLDELCEYWRNLPR